VRVTAPLSATNRFHRWQSRLLRPHFVIYWDDDELREIEDGKSITKYGGATLLTCAELRGEQRHQVLRRC